MAKAGEIARTQYGGGTMRQEQLPLARPLAPLELLEQLPEEAFAASVRRGWVGVEAVRYREQPASENIVPALTHHSFLLFVRTPREFELWSDGIRRFAPPPSGSLIMVPAGSSARYRWSGRSDSLHVFLQPDLVARVAAEGFELDPARVSIAPLDGVDVPQLRAAMLAVCAELTAGAVGGGGLAAESLANVMAVQLIRHILAPRRQDRRKDGALPRTKLRAVVEYVEEHLAAGPTLDQMAAVAQCSSYHFARQFKAATGYAPHQYVIARRVERAQQLLQDGDDLSLANVATGAGFSDQSQFSHHFKRVVGITPGQFRKSRKGLTTTNVDISAD